MERTEWKAFVDELRTQWKKLWRDRIDDKVKAEGIACQDYSSLFVDRGTVIVATRDFKPVDFVEILEHHKPSDVPNAIPPRPAVGGCGKFIRNTLSKQKRFTRRERLAPLKKGHSKNQQKKKGGRGWLHI
ncbi:MAG: hypothetical protein JSV12_00835 [Candidatus Bathyarchaeota archaeon]|nr:MAG: hypothetical protein JSV12_00835 [Candidatus Bathyarchaeota archaeon]